MSDSLPWGALGTELALARHRSARTQQQLARQLGISQAAYSVTRPGGAVAETALVGRRCRLRSALLGGAGPRQQRGDEHHAGPQSARRIRIAAGARVTVALPSAPGDDAVEADRDRQHDGDGDVEPRIHRSR